MFKERFEIMLRKSLDERRLGKQKLKRNEGRMYCKVEIHSGSHNFFGFAFRSIVSRSINKFDITGEIVKDLSAEFEYHGYSI